MKWAVGGTACNVTIGGGLSADTVIGVCDLELEPLAELEASFFGAQGDAIVYLLTRSCIRLVYLAVCVCVC
jgi:hypothetical protein